MISSKLKFADIASVAVWTSGLLCLVALVWQAFTCSPTGDERNQLAASVAMVRTGDVGFYRVNPPVHKILSGVPVNLWYQPRMDSLHYASLMPSGNRHETSTGVAFIRDNAEQYRGLFILGRLVRVPVILSAGWLLAVGLPYSLRRAGQVAAILWFTSPLVLGHGWLIMPDAVSGVVATLLLVTSLRWLVTLSTVDAAMTGVAWGIALSTKFTFCPMVLLWPLMVIVYRAFFWQGFIVETKIQIFGLVTQATMALCVVIALYSGSQVGIPIGQHDFRSDKLSWLNVPRETSECEETTLSDKLTSALRRAPSPLPKQFMIGIDEQQLDLQQGYPTYLLGHWFNGNAWWWIFPAYAMKEQPIVVFGLLLIVPACVVTATRKRHRSKSTAQTQRTAAMTYCALFAGSLFLILALNGKMALNVRYVFPSLPMLYLAIGIGLTSMFQKGQTYRRVVLLVLSAGCIETAMVFPHHFAYVNFLSGGAYRIPAALHATNFDAGQDLWRLERWVSERQWHTKRLYLLVHSDVPTECINLPLRVPDASLLHRAIRSRRGMHTESSQASVTIIVMRGLATPAPWTRIVGGSTDEKYQQLVTELTMYPPDEFLTPTIAVYRVNTQEAVNNSSEYQLSPP